MENWTDLCRCCLSANSEVSLLDNVQNITQKFLEITTIEVKADDGLPQKLCGDCCANMNLAYQFRKQCIKMDTELKLQLNNLLSQCNESNIDNLRNAESDLNQDIEFANDPMKQLEAVIKKEPMDSDDDYYYVLVIDNPKDKENSETLIIKSEKDEVEVKQENVVTGTKSALQISDIYEDIEEEILPTSIQKPKNVEPQTEHNEFDNNMDSFSMTNNIPVNVPATILENEEIGQDDNIGDMDVDESQDHMLPEDLQENELTDVQEITDQNLIKILTSTGEDGTILLKSDGMVQYLTDGGQLVMNDEDGEQSQEVILCEGDESQFQIVKYDGSELVIEYADEGGIATVLQQADDTYLCDCGEQFQNLEEYEKHQHIHNPGGDNLCNLCGKGFESAEILTGHMLLHNVPGLLLQCPFCDQVMKRSALTQHIKYGHNNIKPQCDICNKTFANPNNLKRHMMIHTGIKEFECDICLKRFHQKITMQTHRLTHMNPLNCSQCDTSFKDKEAFDLHKSTLCVKSDAKVELIKTVKQEITTSLGKVLGYACSLCKKMFSIEEALERHIETTHIVDPAELLCSECGEVVSSKKEMQAHILTHDKRKSIKRFECSVCSKGCSSQAMLLMHERVHTNERPFACQLCPLKFKTKTHLRTHQLTHTREKKFGCSVCMKFFALKGNLVVHLRTHTGERPYVCSICEEAFIDSKYLKKHKLKKHPTEYSTFWNQSQSNSSSKKQNVDNNTEYAVPWNQYLKIKYQEQENVEDE